MQANFEFSQAIIMSFFDSELNNYSNCILCFYVNTTKQLQTIRLTNIPNYYWERVVFPGQRLLFAAVISASLEINTSARATAILSDVIPCQQLRVIDSSSSTKYSPANICS